VLLRCDAPPRLPDSRFVTEVGLRAYTDADLELTIALETDPAMMTELGGPRALTDLRKVHERRLHEPWFLVITDSDGVGGAALGTIGIWETEHDGARLHETGWMVLPDAQGRGVASAALRTLIERAQADGGFDALHAYPAVTNGPSNRLCDKFGFASLEVAEFVFAGHTLRCRHRVLAL
jgi:RimJ/RimL family protein N-acetyltransferase